MTPNQYLPSQRPTMEPPRRQTMQWSGRGWVVDIWPDFVVTSSGMARQIEFDRADKVRVRRGLFTWRLMGDEGTLLKLRGSSRTKARQIRDALRVLQARQHLEDLTAWHHAVSTALEKAEREQRWFASELLQRLIDSTPPRTTRAVLTSLRVTHLLTDFETEALSLLDRDLSQEVANLNKQILENELETQRDFLNTIESSPLTREQAEAVICFDSRVRLLAAAGSGKTSVMIARAAYAVKKGFVHPRKILLLAFNKAAAEELQQRITDRFAAAGIASEGIRASTFHSLGLAAIGKGSGSKPRLAKWLDSGDDLTTVLEIVDNLRDIDPDFRYKWDLYRMVFAQVSSDISFSAYDGYDKVKRRRGFRTLRGEIVKSHGERLIADFLFLNGVNYEYERPYDHDVSDSRHSQYKPDFYYPDVNVWHEHWALDAHGRPPSLPNYDRYLASKAWKLDLHKRFKTQLVQTTFADVVFGNGLSKLQRNLESRGLKFDWNPDREIPSRWARPLEHPALAKLVRTFMAHVKSNSLSQKDIEHNLKQASPDDSYFGFRSQLFLDIFWPIHDAWNRRLKEEKTVDFEDMLLIAADLLEDGSTDLNYDLVLVDEFQDSSQARARMIHGLVSKPDRFLLAVGDDWQSINRFAGADISVMRNFEARFGSSLTLALTNTFRCPHGIAQVAKTFVARNPHQLKKGMVALSASGAKTVEILPTPEGSLDPILNEILLNSNGEPSTVLILSRYNFLKPEAKHKSFPGLDTTFRTIHSSKGLEADYVIVIGVTTGIYGFPSSIADDPVLQLAMPEAESFPDAEERRLLYVALTRARRKVYLLTSATNPSPFVVELLRDHHVENRLGVESGSGACPSCGLGLLKERQGPTGSFLGCSRFPICGYTS